jgi:two-component system OmpR family response regulator
VSAQQKVLVVDDEESLTDLIGLALRYEQFEVAVAHTGHEALSSVRSFHPDLIVLDVMLPGIDGFEVAKALAGEAPSTPILFLTAAMRPRTSRGLTLGGTTTRPNLQSRARRASAPSCGAPSAPTKSACSRSPTWR